MLYYKIESEFLRTCIAAIGAGNYQAVNLGLQQQLQARNWVMDDVDYPEAVEAAEEMAFGEQREWKIDQNHSDGKRWITERTITRLRTMCLNESPTIVHALVTIINHSPYPEDLHGAELHHGSSDDCTYTP